MITKRSRFWTIVFAFLPGAGHMYNGFMKLGVSFMGLFFGLWMVASVINIGPLTFLAPVIWFYAFFDCINKIFQDDDEFYSQEDYFLITREKLENLNLNIFKQGNLLVGVVLVIVGIYTLWNNVVMHLISSYGMLPPVVYQTIINLGNIVPQLVIGGLIIWAGVAMIMGKKREIEVEDKAADFTERGVKEGTGEEVNGDDGEK